MNRQQYLGELTERLFSRGVPPEQTREIVAEVESHLIDSGDDPIETFGLPDSYAASVVAGRWRRDAWTMLLIAALAGSGGWLAALAVSEWIISGGPVTVQLLHIFVVAVLILAVLAVFSPLLARRFPRTRTRLVIALVAVTLGGLATGLFSLTPASEVALVHIDVPVALAVGVGLLVAAGLASVVTQREREADTGILRLTRKRLSGSYRALIRWSRSKVPR